MRTIMFFSSVLCALLLAGCGGGGSDNDAVPTSTSEAEGLYNGTTDTNQAISGLVLDDGTFYMVYSLENNQNLIAGVIQGNTVANSGSLTSDNAQDFNIEGLGVFPATVSATYAPKQSINGKVSYQDGSVTNFSSTYDSDYEIAPSLTDLTGTFTGEVAFSLGHETATVTVSPTGSISGIGSSGCTMTGSVTPRSSGNVYNVSLSFGDAPCYFQNQTMNGIGYYDSNTKKLWAATPNADRTEGIIFIGSKP